MVVFRTSIVSSPGRWLRSSSARSAKHIVFCSVKHRYMPLIGSIAALLMLATEASAEKYYDAHVNFSAHGRLYQTTATLQVVTSPMLDRTLSTGQPNPIYEAAWASLVALEPEHARFQPWFPFPRKAVAELFPPDDTGTHWDFSNFLPQLLAFVNATFDRGRAINLNVAAHPCWLFADWRGRPLNCSPPASADTLDFDYGKKGQRSHLVDRTGTKLVEYFTRVFSYLSVGEFTDEDGTVHRGGPALNLSRASTRSTWEVFNEMEHGCALPPGMTTGAGARAVVSPFAFAHLPLAPACTRIASQTRRRLMCTTTTPSSTPSQDVSAAPTCLASSGLVGASAGSGRGGCTAAAPSGSPTFSTGHTTRTRACRSTT